jgi:predicted amidohydrolase YtcJ
MTTTLPVTSPQHASGAEWLLVNGKIWTGASGAAGTPAEVDALLVGGGRVLAAGSRADVEGLATPAARVVDLGGRRAVPGLIDGHIHAVRAGLTWDRELRWMDTKTLAEGLATISARARETPAGEWIRVVGGWHPSQLVEKRLPTRAELDAAAPDHPVYVQALYEGAVLNSAALTACGWDAASADPPGGKLGRDAAGKLTGELQGMVGFLTPLSKMPAHDAEGQVGSTLAMFNDLARLGLTGVVDPGGMGISLDQYEPLFELWRQGRLPLRTRLYYSASAAGAELEEFEGLTRYAKPRFGDDWLKPVGIGELVHYDWHEKGVLRPHDIPAAAREEFVRISRLAAERGWAVHMHAILPGTIEAVLDAWERVDREVPLRGRRFSIAHGDSISAEGLRRAESLGIGMGIQNWLVHKSNDACDAWGEEAAEHAPPLRDILDRGIPVGAGSDSTRANSENPWLSLWWLVTGKSRDGGPRRAERHRLTRAEALELYTRSAAWFSFEEETRGTLEPGRLADVAVLSEDYFACEEDAIPDVQAELTLVGGTPVYKGSAFQGL